MKAERHKTSNSSHGCSEGEQGSRGQKKGRESREGPLARMGSGSQGPVPNPHVPQANQAPQGGKFCEALVPREAEKPKVF